METKRALKYFYWVVFGFSLLRLDAASAQSAFPPQNGMPGGPWGNSTPKVELRENYSIQLTGNYFAEGAGDIILTGTSPVFDLTLADPITNILIELVTLEDGKMAVRYSISSTFSVKSSDQPLAIQYRPGGIKGTAIVSLNKPFRLVSVNKRELNITISKVAEGKPAPVK